MTFALLLLVTGLVFYLFWKWANFYLKPNISLRLGLGLMMVWFLDLGVLVRLAGG